MRILRVAQKVYPEVTGGGPYHVHALSRDQATMGHDVTVLTVGGEAASHTGERDGYTVIRYPATVRALGNDVSVGVGEYLRSSAGEYDIVHAHSHLYFSTNLAAMARTLSGTPLSITNHGLYSQNAPEWMFDAYLRSVGKWTLDRADTVFCYTDVDRRRLREFGVTSEVSVVPNGIDTGRFTASGPSSDLIDTDGPVVLFVGRLVEGKRPRVAVDALAGLRARGYDARLFLCGDGPLREELRAHAESRGISERVTFLGQRSYEEMPAIYRSADVLVLPSRAEGVPRTVLEAMASGVPVVCSSLEQVEAVIGDAGTTVPVGDVEAFVDALDPFVSDPESRERAGDAGREAVDKGHDWGETVRRTTEVLEGVARSC